MPLRQFFSRPFGYLQYREFSRPGTEELLVPGFYKVRCSKPTRINLRHPFVVLSSSKPSPPSSTSTGIVSSPRRYSPPTPPRRHGRLDDPAPLPAAVIDTAAASTTLPLSLLPSSTPPTTRRPRILRLFSDPSPSRRPRHRPLCSVNEHSTLPQSPLNFFHLVNH